MGIKFLKAFLVAASFFSSVNTHQFSFQYLSQGQAQQQQDIPDGWESYLGRPDILKTEGKEQNLGESWNKLRDAHFTFVAELLEFYPNHHFYFLARDSEYLYDAARLATYGTKEASQIHLLNVSRANMRDVNIKSYLADNGISEEVLLAGKNVLFVDTGFSGTIPRVIAENFSAAAKAQLKTHLIASSNPQHPSSRAFLLHLNPAVNSGNPSNMHGSIVSYEHMPRFTDRSSKFIFNSGKWHPISSLTAASDGSVSKEFALKYTSDIKASWTKEKTRKNYAQERVLIRNIKSLFQTGDEASIAQLKELLSPENAKIKPLIQSILLDVEQAKVNQVVNSNLTLEQLGMKKSEYMKTGNNQPNLKNELIKKFPQWQTYLEDPQTNIPKLFQAGDWQTIGALLDAKVDAEIDKILINLLFDAPAKGPKKSLQIATIEKGDMKVLSSLTAYTFSKPYAADMKDLIRLTIENGNMSVLWSLTAYTFSQLHTADMKDLIRLTIEKGDMSVLSRLAASTFSKPHAADMKDLIRLTIEKGDMSVLSSLTANAFSQPHTADMKDLIRLTIEKGDMSVLSSLTAYTFSQPHTADMKDLIRLTIEKGNMSVLRSLATSIFSQPHTQSKDWDVLRQSLKITDAAERKIFLAKSLDPIMPQQKPITVDLKPGDHIEVAKESFEVLSVVGRGKRGIVFQVRDHFSRLRALKVAVDSTPETLKSIQNESQKMQALKQLGIPHTPVLFQGDSFVLKPWVEGLRGDQWLEEYNKNPKAHEKELNRLYETVRKILNQGAYVGDFRPANMIYNGKAWVVIDAGSTATGKTFDEAFAKLNEKFPRRWKVDVNPILLIKKPQVKISCENLF